MSRALHSSKEAADYTSKGTKSEHCSICRYWSPGANSKSDGICSIVAGAINPKGWCRYFEDEPEVA